MSSVSSSRLRAEYPLPDPAGPLTVQFSDVAYSVTEGQGSVTITVILNRAATEEVRVNYATANSTATSPADYDSASGLLVFTPGQTSKTFSVYISNDALFESDEFVTLSLSNPVNVQLGIASTATLTITDDEVPAPSVQFSSPTFEVSEGAGTATITVTLSHESPSEVTVDYATSNDTALAPDDYLSASGQLIFAPGETVKTFAVTIIDDSMSESNENVHLTLSNSVMANLWTQYTASLTIADNENPLPTVQFAVSTSMVSESGIQAVIEVTLNATSSQVVSVEYTTADGTATSGHDYAAAFGQLLFEPGETQKSFLVPILEDSLFEPSDELVDLYLSNPVGATLGSVSQSTLSIMDNDTALPFLSFSEGLYSFYEEEGTVVVTVLLSQPSNETVTVYYFTQDGVDAPNGLEFGATAPADYTSTSGTLEFPPGLTEQTISIPIVTEDSDSRTEHFFVLLQDPAFAAFQNPTMPPKAKAEAKEKPDKRDNEAAVDLDIADGQGGAILIEDNEDDNRGAVTVANMNDTNGDGKPDSATNGPVKASSTAFSGQVPINTTVIPVNSTTGFVAGDRVIVRKNEPLDKSGHEAVVGSVQAATNTITLTSGVKTAFAAGSVIHHLGRDEVDLMQLIVRRPAAAGQTKKLTLSLVNATASLVVWKSPTKGDNSQKVTLPAEFDSIDDVPANGLILWVEATDKSANVRHIHLKLEFQGQWDSVKATAVWVEQGRGPWYVRGEKRGNTVPTGFATNNPSVGPGKNIDSLTHELMVNKIEQERIAADGSRYGIGACTVKNGEDTMFQGRILMEFKVVPVGAELISGVKFDITRQQQRRIDTIKIGTHEVDSEFSSVKEWPWIPPGVLAPDGIEHPNDDPGPAAKQVTGALLYSWDAPGVERISIESYPFHAFKFYRSNFFEFARVSFNGNRPDGDILAGSMCSVTLAWHCSHFVTRTAAPDVYTDDPKITTCAPKFEGKGNGTITLAVAAAVTEGFTVKFDKVANKWITTASKTNPPQGGFACVYDNNAKTWTITVPDKLTLKIKEGTVAFENNDTYRFTVFRPNEGVTKQTKLDLITVPGVTLSP